MNSRVPQGPVRVLIVDDSAVIRGLLKRRLNEHRDITVIGTATDPFDAHDKIRALKPDVLTLDIEMPKMDGLTFLSILMARHPLPVVIMSSISTQGSAHAMEALRLGAVDVLAKPSNSAGLKSLLEELPDKVLAAAASRVGPPATGTAETGILPAVAWRSADEQRLILLGASTGGTEALCSVLSRLPADMPPILLVQHIPAHFSRTFAERLNAKCAMDVKEAEDNDAVIPGRVLVAPGGIHLTLQCLSGGHRRVVLDDGPKVYFQRPAVDRLFDSALPEARHVVAGIMTGMGRDGAEALLRLRQSGARTIGQDANSCVVYGMPRAAHEIGACESMVPLSLFSRSLLDLLIPT